MGGDPLRELAAVEAVRRPRPRAARGCLRSSGTASARRAQGLTGAVQRVALGRIAEQPIEDLWRYACASFRTTPSRASFAAGASRSGQGTDPQRCSPPRGRGRSGHGHGHGAGVEDLLRVAEVDDDSMSSDVPCARPGTATKKSSSSVRASPARWTSRNPPPPGPVSGLSQIHETAAAAMHASTALPPAAERPPRRPR